MRCFRWKPRLKYPVIGQVRDVFGHVWHVRDIHTTKHGWDLLFGSPDSYDRRFWGLARLIPTHDLINYWETNRTNRDNVLYDLPAGRTTLKRVRHRFGFHLPNDVNTDWKERLEDLRTLKARDFAARYNIDIQVVFENRRKKLGKVAREIGWWRTPETLAILRSDLKLREIGQKLGIGTTHARRLKIPALELEQEMLPEPHAQGLRPAA